MSPLARRIATLSLLGLLGACASAPTPVPRPETAWFLLADNQLLRTNAGIPGTALQRLKVSGLAQGEQLIGIDFRSTNERLYALGRSGRLYTISLDDGLASQVGSTNVTLRPELEYGFDFNPVADRLRVVNAAGDNLRLHPDTGAQVDGDATQAGVQPDGNLQFAAGDVAAGKAPAVLAAAYTYSKVSKTATTNYAIDAAGNLLTQGSREGTTPVVGPNLGQLFSVGSLGVQPIGPVGFDISWKDNAAFASLRAQGRPSAELYLLDLNTGRASSLGAIAGAQPVLGLAIAPSW